MTLPETEHAMVLRTDFSDDLAWHKVCGEIRAPVGEVQAYVDFISDPIYDGAAVRGLLQAVSAADRHGFIFLVDETTFRHPEHPILVVNLGIERGRTFRVIPSEMWAVENNLSIANMGFEEFADNVDPDGIYRGVREDAG